MFPAEDASRYKWARAYADLGLAVVPAHDKKPTDDWRDFQTRMPTAGQHKTWFSTGANLFVITGRISRVVVLDCDSDLADRWWRSILGDDVMSETTQSLSGSGRGRHYWFRLGDQDQRGRSVKIGEMKWDLRAEGGGVIVPPSGHESGGTYQWINDFSHLAEWPYPVLPDSYIDDDGESKPVPGDNQHRSHLADLLANPGAGGRNNWVAAVLGHHAASQRFYDAYLGMAETVWDQATRLSGDHDYTRQEFDATVESIWRKEQSKGITKEATATSGWLAGNGLALICPIVDKDTSVAKLGVWANFDVTAKAVIRGEDGTQHYLLDLTRDVNGSVVSFPDVLVPASTFGGNDSTSKWLASRGLITNVVEKDRGSRQRIGTRLQAYIESQNPPVRELFPHMGWVSDGVYATGAGVITASGFASVDATGTMADPKVVGDQIWDYGFAGSMEQAQAILREVMTFHDQVACAMFGAVWAMAPLKGAAMRLTSLFPITTIIAPSESGKTNGFFDLMLQANGRATSGGVFTFASLRDDLARHRGGFVWIDDPSHVEELGELLRAVANEGLYSRKSGAQWDGTARTHLVAPVVLSAEGLAMLAEKAMSDRSIRFEVSNPTSRMSRHDPDRPQWDDIVNLQQKVGRLNQYAGWYVQRALQWYHEVGGLEGVTRLFNSLKTRSNRQSEKYALMRLGARVLEYVMGEPAPVEVAGIVLGDSERVDWAGIVDSWVQGQVTADGGFAGVAPYLAEVVLPGFLADQGFLPSIRTAPISPVWYGVDGKLRVNIQGLTQWWAQQVYRQADRHRAAQLGGLDAMTQELKQIGGVPSPPVKGKRYMVISEEMSAYVVNRAGFDSHDPRLLPDDEILDNQS